MSPTTRVPTFRPTWLPGLIVCLLLAGCVTAGTSPTGEPPTGTPPTGGPTSSAMVEDRTVVVDHPPTDASGEAVPLSFEEFYDGYDIRTGLILSDTLRSLAGRRVRMEGYMAPPLKPDLDFFVLTRIRMAYCPFCSTAADWPDDIAVVYLTQGTMRATDRPLRLEGVLELGARRDEQTGLLSIVRIRADHIEPL
ncbi:MAG: hypothetical protein KF809_05815 [Chloroflexi bacterium]|nr:hypothetical protein [Chloroflexota bacterium]